ncbi:multidrug effflux MFS transporter [Pseudohaliea sp.]|uniref:multidrug effflux MFS transporter n=1 Tax=Pseudohaliea sp. TaxID=2740289 RepID=UPI0032EAD84A
MPLLAVISGLSSFSLAIILPALPALAGVYGTDYAGIQFLVSAYLLGLALSQPLWGQVTDRIGRRPVVLLGFTVYVAASLACLVAENLELLMLLRALQAAGASTGTVVARAIIRDTHDEADGARAMSWVSIGLGAAPIIAPVIGGVLLIRGSPGSIFAVMAVTGAVLWLLLYLRLPETLEREQVQLLDWRRFLDGYRALLTNRGFLGYTAVYGFAQGAFFAFLTVGAAVFADSFDLGPGVFGAVWGTMGFAYVLGAFGGGRLASGVRRPLLLPVGVSATLALGLAVLAFDAWLGPRLLTVLVPLFLMMLLSGAVTPLVMAGAVYQVPGLAGTAAGLSSALGMTISGAFTVAAGMVYGGDFTPIALLIATGSLLTFLSWLSIRQR